MGQSVTIALGTFKESVRERFFYNLVVFAFLMIGATPCPLTLPANRISWGLMAGRTWDRRAKSTYGSRSKA